MITAGNAPRDLTAQLHEVWHSTADLLEHLEGAEWDAPTDCPGWSVQDHVAHIIGTESMLAGHDTPPAPDSLWSDYVKNDIGALNEAWVLARRDRPPASLLTEFRAVTEERVRMLEEMTEADFDAPSWTPVGNATYARFMQIRVFDCWIHEQDIRRALARPGHDHGPAVEQSLDEIERSLGYIVGKRAGAPAGSRIAFALTGPAACAIYVAVDGRAAVVEALDGPPDVTLELDAVDFAALACGRVDPSGVPLTVTGDENLGSTIASNLAFTI